MRVQFYTSAVDGVVDVDLGDATQSVTGAKLWELAIVLFKTPAKVLNLTCSPVSITPDPDVPAVTLPPSACTKQLCVHVVTRELTDPSHRDQAARLAEALTQRAHVPPYRTYSYT